jgi:hypothetical protein
MEVLLPEACMIEKKERNDTRFRLQYTCRSLPQSLLYMRPEGTMEYYTDQTRPDQTRPDQITEAKFSNSGTFIHEAKKKSSSDPVPLREDPDPHQIRLLGPTNLPPKGFFVRITYGITKAADPDPPCCALRDVLFDICLFFPRENFYSVKMYPT